MLDRNKLHELWQRELTRKEFLQVVGLMLLSVIGIGGLLGNMDKILTSKPSEKSAGYGMSAYGR